MAKEHTWEQAETNTLFSAQSSFIGVVLIVLYCLGGVTAGPGTVLKGFIYEGDEYQRGDTYECQACGERFHLAEHYTGQKVSREIERVEAHIKYLEMHAECECVEEEAKEEEEERRKSSN